MSRWRVVSPALRLAGTIALLALVLNLFIQPAAARAMREELFKVRTDLASSLVREGEFTEPVKGLTVYAQSVDGNGDLHNLFIHQTKSDGSATVYMANQGRMAKRNGQAVLVLRDGSTQEFSSRGVLQFLTFNEYPFELGTLSNSAELIHYKPSDRYLHELLMPDLQQDWERRNRLSLMAEGHARLSSPLYSIAFMAMALSAILGGGFSRLGYGRRIALMGAAAVLVRIIGFGVQSACEDTAWLNIAQYLVPIAATAFALRSVFRQRVSRFIDMHRRPARIAPVAA
jgi:lipopolysaccharide export system permease protein